MATNKQLIKRWTNVERVLKGLSPHERNNHFDMESWGHATDCGTVACAAGHCSLDPWFQAHGFRGVLREHYSGAYIEINGADNGIFKPQIRDVCVKYFGAKGTDEVFMSQKRSTVVGVLRAVRSHIKTLQAKE